VFLLVIVIIVTIIIVVDFLLLFLLGWHWFATARGPRRRRRRSAHLVLRRARVLRRAQLTDALLRAGDEKGAGRGEARVGQLAAVQVFAQVLRRSRTPSVWHAGTRDTHSITSSSSTSLLTHSERTSFQSPNTSMDSTNVPCSIQRCTRLVSCSIRSIGLGAAFPAGCLCRDDATMAAHDRADARAQAGQSGPLPWEHSILYVVWPPGGRAAFAFRTPTRSDVNPSPDSKEYDQAYCTITNGVVLPPHPAPVLIKHRLKLRLRTAHTQT
jgi:hypothetical protein